MLLQNRLIALALIINHHQGNTRILLESLMTFGYSAIASSGESWEATVGLTPRPNLPTLQRTNRVTLLFHKSCKSEEQLYQHRPPDSKKQFWCYQCRKQCNVCKKLKTKSIVVFLVVWVKLVARKIEGRLETGIGTSEGFGGGISGGGGLASEHESRKNIPAICWAFFTPPKKGLFQ